MDRRNFLRLAGGGVVMAAAGCAPGGLDPAAAWATAAQETDVRRFALSHALLAPNPHNRQPWRARLEGADAIALFVDTERLLPITDPFSRQIVIGCGAFSELLALAAGAKGMAAEVAAWPEGEPGAALDDRPFARVRLSPTSATVDPLFAQVRARRSYKEVFDAERTPPAAELARLTQAGVGPGLRTGFTSARAEVAPFRTLVADAFTLEMKTPAALKESVDLMRIGRREVAQHRDGIDLTGAPLEAMAAIGLLTREKMLTPGTIAYEQGLRLYGPLADSANAFAWLISVGNDRTAQLAAGRAYARMNLAATATGIAIHPMSQSLQEYAEMAAFKAQADRLTGVRPGERLQMLVRVGYGKDIPPSPRRGLSEHMIA